MKIYSKIIAEVDGKFIRSDGSSSAPLNSKRTVNTTQLTEGVTEAKNFEFFPDDVEPTKRQNRNLIFYCYNFTETETGLTWQKHPDQLKNFRLKK